MPESPGIGRHVVASDRPDRDRVGIEPPDGVDDILARRVRQHDHGRAGPVGRHVRADQPGAGGCCRGHRGVGVGCGGRLGRTIGAGSKPEGAEHQHGLPGEAV